MQSNLSPTNVISKYAVVLSLVEVGFGSLLHAFKIPLSGQVLSLNQGFLLSRATLESQVRTAANSISAIAALLKSLSPAGKKLTPMLAISMQGLLFALGTSIFGVNVIGLIVGMTLLCLWAFVQPILIYLLLYGKTIVDVANYFLEQLQTVMNIDLNAVLWGVLALVVLKVIIGFVIIFAAVKLPDKKIQSYLEQLEKLGRNKLLKSKSLGVQRSPLLLALCDLLTPSFIISLLLTATFFFVTRQETTEIVWGLLRPVAFGFIIFYLIRILPFETLVGRLKNTRLSQFAESALRAISAIKHIEIK